MQLIKRKTIDWVETGANLAALRLNDDALNHYACFVCHSEEWECGGGCATCERITPYQRAQGNRGLDPFISCSELAKVFGVSESVIRNWEAGRTPVPLDALYFYYEITRKGDNFQDFLDAVVAYR